MKKKVLFGVLAIVTMLSVSGCGNKQVFDTTMSFERGIVSLPNGEVVEGKVTSWRDFEDGDQIQVKIAGKTYLVHGSNVALISE